MVHSDFDLTPVIERGGLLLKRDDFYAPFSFSPMNGSKLRQCKLLVEKNIKKAEMGIVTGTSVLSPQGAILASVAKHLSLPCTIYYGGVTQKSLFKHKYPVVAMSMGARCSIVSKLGYTSVLRKKAEQTSTETGAYLVEYGFDLLDNIDVFIDSVATQTQNLPRTDNLVVTVGSAITILGILTGIAKYGVSVDKIYGIGCAPNRLNKIRNYSAQIEQKTGLSLPVEKLIYVDAFNRYKGFKYEDEFDINYRGVSFHPRYEAKTFRWLMSNKLQGTTLMWITGSDIKVKAQ